MTLIVVSRGGIFLLREDGNAVGYEITKTRPCVIVQNDIANLSSPVTIIVKMTSDNGNKKIYPTMVFISARETVTADERGIDKDSFILCNQIYTVDKQRLLAKLGRVPDKKMQQVDMALIYSLDLDYT